MLSSGNTNQWEYQWIIGVSAILDAGTPIKTWHANVGATKNVASFGNGIWSSTHRSAPSLEDRAWQIVGKSQAGTLDTCIIPKVDCPPSQRARLARLTGGHQASTVIACPHSGWIRTVRWLVHYARKRRDRERSLSFPAALCTTGTLGPQRLVY